MTSSLIGKQAVVVGAGMAGLPAARALADYFEQVVVLERDTLPFVASHRTGIAQGRHTHALLAGGSARSVTSFPALSRILLTPVRCR
jgi:flavin-dependent dehydrogenase